MNKTRRLYVMLVDELSYNPVFGHVSSLPLFALSGFKTCSIYCHIALFCCSQFVALYLFPGIDVIPRSLLTYSVELILLLYHPANNRYIKTPLLLPERGCISCSGLTRYFVSLYNSVRFIVSYYLTVLPQKS